MQHLIRKFTFFVLFIFVTTFVHAQLPTFPPVDTIGEPIHEVTLFTMSTMYPFDWSSPSHLYKSVSRCLYKTIGLRDNYLIGHMAISLSTPLLEKPVFLAMTSTNKPQHIELVLRKKIGLSILGATLDGRMEEEEHLLHMLEVYAKRHKLAYITIRVNEAAMKQILEFVREFSQVRPNEYHPSEHYGGSYWPLYQGEGAGCSAFAFGLMTTADVLPPETDTCLIQVKIPMKLMGGEYNQNRKVHYRQILKTKSWYNEAGIPNVDYVSYCVYEPSILYDWILSKHARPDSVYHLVEQYGIPGLAIDFRQKALPLQKPFFVKRPDSNIFIEISRQKLRSKFPGIAF